MGTRGWIFGACLLASAWLGCGDEGAMTAPSNAGGAYAAGFGGTGATVLPPQGGAGVTPGSAGAAGSAGMQPPAMQPDASVTTPPPAAGAPADAGAGAPPDAGQAGAGEWTLLMEESWTLDAGGEVPQWCADKTLTEDVYISAIRPVHPLGTHHTTLNVLTGDTPCSSAAVLQNGLIYAAGVGTEALRMPEGVAMKLSAGQILRLGLHIYNVSDEPLSGVSGIEVVRVDPEDVVHEAELMLSGPVRFMIEPGLQTITHSCNVTEAQTVFALFPHMHQLGVHLKTTVRVGGQNRVLHDGEYVFEEQYHIPIEPLQLNVGDTITTECTYQNTRGATVGFGESSDTEMCFSIFFRYPATGNSFCGRAF